MELFGQLRLHTAQDALLQHVGVGLEGLHAGNELSQDGVLGFLLLLPQLGQVGLQLVSVCQNRTRKSALFSLVLMPGLCESQVRVKTFPGPYIYPTPLGSTPMLETLTLPGSCIKGCIYLLEQRVARLLKGWHHTGPEGLPVGCLNCGA